MRSWLLVMAGTAMGLTAGVPEERTAAVDVLRQVAVVEKAAVAAEGGDKMQLEAASAAVARIQSDLYELERWEAARGNSEDERLDALKESADQLTELTGRAQVVEGKSLKRVAKSAEREAKRLGRGMREWQEKGANHAR